MIVNFLLFQLGWFASVLLAARHVPWAGVLVVGVLIVVHLATKGTRREFLLIVAAVAMGAVADSFLLHAGLVDYASPTPPEWLAPAWILAMWANFAVTLRHSLGWLSGRWALAGILGAVAGPAAYWGAASLGAAQLTSPVLASCALALVWGVALPALLWVSARYR